MKIENLCMSFGTQTIFDNISFQINNNDKVGIIGVNGAGKSTLFNILLGNITPDAGNITLNSKIKLGYLPQVIMDDASNEEETVLITDELKNENVLVRDNKVYYLKNDGIYEYNLDTKENKCIINGEGDISIINVLGDYIYINKDGEELIYKISSALKIVLSNYIKEEYSIVNLTDAGIVIKQDGQLKIFSFITNKILNDTFDLEGYNNTYSLYLGNDLYYMNLELNNNKKHIIIDMSSKKIIKEFKENYLYIWRNV